MALEGFSIVEQDTFRGLRTLEDNLKVPQNWSPDCQNVDFRPGIVFKRDGTLQAASFAGGSILSMKEFVSLDTLTRRLLVLVSNGSLQVESGNLIFSTITNTIVEASLASSLRMKSATLFGREYIAWSKNGEEPIARPTQYDGTNYDPVSPEGPGTSPFLTLTNGGIMSVGVHKFRLLFETRSGYITSPGPEGAITLSATQRSFNLSNIQTGPPWVTKRIFALTPEGSDDYFFVPGTNMELNDNVTTTITNINITDEELLSATAVSSTTDSEDDLLQQIVLPAQTGVVAYHGRLAWFGERQTNVRSGTTLQESGFYNLTFDSGIASGGTEPAGWSAIGVGIQTVTDSGAFGFVYKVTGDAGGNQQGRMENAIPFIEGGLPVGVSLRCRMRARKSAGALAGTVHVQIGTSGGPNVVGGFTVNVSQMSSTEYRVFDGEMLSAVNNVPTTLSRLRMSSGGVGVGGTAITNGESVFIDEIEIYAAGEAIAGSRVRWSKIDEPEAYDDLTGIQLVSENDGQIIRAAFVLNDTVYYCKNNSLHSTNDNGSTEPNEWNVTAISTSVGALSSNAVATADGWAIIADRAGIYYTDGRTLENISYEILGTWQTVNFAKETLVSVQIDQLNKRIYVAIPTSGSTTINTVLMCRYYGPTPISEAGRDWAPWTLKANAITISKRSTGSFVTYFGTNDAVGKLLQLDDTRLDDYATGTATAIDAFYQTSYFGQGFGRKLFGYLEADASGIGQLQTAVFKSDTSTSEILNDKLLLSKPKFYHEWQINLNEYRLSLRFRVSRIGEDLTLRYVALAVKSHPWHMLRGNP